MEENKMELAFNGESLLFPSYLAAKLAERRILKEQARSLLVILGKLPEWDGQTGRISLTQMAQKTGIARPHVSRALNGLVENKIIKKGKSRNVFCYGLNTDCNKWAPEKSGKAQTDFSDDGKRFYLPKDMLANLARCQLAPGQLQCLWNIIYNSWGQGQATAQMDLSDFVSRSGLDKKLIRDYLKNMEARRIITLHTSAFSSRYSTAYSININYEEWLPESLLSDSSRRVRPGKEYLSVKDVSKILQVTCNTVRKWHRKNGLPGTRFGNAVYYKENEIMEWLGKQRQSPSRHVQISCDGKSAEPVERKGKTRKGRFGANPTSILLTLKEENYAQLKAMAEKEGAPVSQIARRAVLFYLSYFAIAG